MASRQMVRTSGTVTTSRGSRNEYRISTLTPLLTAADELWFASGEPLPGLGRCRTLGGTGRQRERDPEAGRNGPDEVQPAAVGLHQRPGQGQADAVAAIAGAPALEEAGSGLGVDPRPLVLDGEVTVVAGRLHHHPDRAGAVAEGVVEEHVEGLPDRAGSGPDPNRPGRDEGRRPPFHLEAGGEVAQVGRGQHGEV